MALVPCRKQKMIPLRHRFQGNYLRQTRPLSYHAEWIWNNRVRKCLLEEHLNCILKEKGTVFPKSPNDDLSHQDGLRQQSLKKEFSWKLICSVYRMKGASSYPKSLTINLHAVFTGPTSTGEAHVNQCTLFGHFGHLSG